MLQERMFGCLLGVRCASYRISHFKSSLFSRAVGEDPSLQGCDACLLVNTDVSEKCTVSTLRVRNSKKIMYENLFWQKMYLLCLTHCNTLAPLACACLRQLKWKMRRRLHITEYKMAELCKKRTFSESDSYILSNISFRHTLM